MDTRALFEMETSAFCPARERQEYSNRDDDRKWNKWGGGAKKHLYEGFPFKKIQKYKNDTFYS